MITAHAGFSASPITNPNPELVENFVDLPTSNISIYADATDSTDPSAVFTFAWSILNPRTGQTATISTLGTTLDNVAAVWGDVRLFVVATNTATGLSSESDPRLAPASAFCTLKIESESKALTLPAIGAREWWRSFDSLAQAVEDLELTDQAISTATINNAGELILTLNDGTVINAGQARGSDGTNGTDGADGISVTSASVSGSNQLTLTMSDGSTINAGTITDNDTRRLIYATGPLYHYFDGTLHAGINPNKRVWIAGPWVAHTALTIQLFSITLMDGGPLNNAMTFDLTLTSAGAYALSANTPPASSASFSVTQATAAEPLTATSSALNISVSAGQLFGICISAPSAGAVHGLNINIVATEL